MPDGSCDPLQALTVSKLPSGELMLSWAPSCLATDTDHAVYEGTIGSYYSHTPALCSTGGTTSAVLRTPVHDAYYIVAPRNAAREGSHGFSDFGVERPAGPLTCLPRAVAACPPACTHDICVAGGPLDPACSDCVADICAQVPECCATGWSTDCADWAQRSCAPECG